MHEVDFCSTIATESKLIFATDPSAFPFGDARVEGFGKGSTRRKRMDLRFFDAADKVVLCGEVKMPGTPEGHSPYDDDLCQDALLKADAQAVKYFFTWNVNTFVLWDRSQYDRPFLDRRVKEWKLGRTFDNAQQVGRAESLDFIKRKFLPDLLRDLADIFTGRRRDWAMPPDDVFIRSLESHLDWPVGATRQFLVKQTEADAAFNAHAEQWLADQDWPFVRGNEDAWQRALDNMARTLAYVWTNRLIFYKALRARFPELPRLELRRTIRTADHAVRLFNDYFERAVERSGDYEPLLFPNTKDWANDLVFQAPDALDAWRGLLKHVESVDFKEVSSDIVGRIFQKLIGPEERHRYGQHFTRDDPVDLINAFCIHRGTDAVLDPACGSGSFLVRAYYRKRHLAPSREHIQNIAELFGCDIAVYPAHLATLNLAAREINEEANYPRIARRDFFETEPGMAFCEIPDNTGDRVGVPLPSLDAIVGNPPYVRQEKIEREHKTRNARVAQTAWRDIRLSGRADLHCYFWPVASKLLKPDGYFGFLTSSSWLDVEYGFALQGWILRHFKILAILESAAEPWFTDARVKTAMTILHRCDDEAERMSNLVRFVRFNKPLKDVIGVGVDAAETDRQAAIERLRDRILGTDADAEDDALRIIVKHQRDLWNDGVRAGTALRETQGDAPEIDEEDVGDEDSPGSDSFEIHEGEYVAGKWGRYLRAPDIYFEIMRRFGSGFVPLGEIAQIRRGITSGCDAFFMPLDVSEAMLRECPTEKAFRERFGAPRKEVESGVLRVIKAGDGSKHIIEAEFLAPEVHSLMKVDRPVVRARDLDRVVLLVDKPMKDLRGTWVHRYLKYGETATFPSKKSKAVPVPQRSTCAARDPWYDLTKLVKPGFAFWPMAQQYRHIIAGNPEQLTCNHNLFDLSSDLLSKRETAALCALLNSSLIGLFKTFYGRWAGTEGNLKTEVVDVNLLDVPDPRGIDRAVADRLAEALKSLSRRPIGRLVESQLMERMPPERARRIGAGPVALPEELKQDDRRALDDACFEHLGVSDAAERTDLIERLYRATALHFRQIRVVEIEKQEQRTKAANKRFSAQELAADAWDAAALEDAVPLAEWVGRRPECTKMVHIPDERPAALSSSPMFDPETVYFGLKRQHHVECASVEEARLVVRLAELGLSGNVAIPADEGACQALRHVLNKRHNETLKRLDELARSRIGNEKLQAQVIDQLVRWFVHGRVATLAPTDGSTSNESGESDG